MRQTKESVESSLVHFRRKLITAKEAEVKYLRMSEGLDDATAEKDPIYKNLMSARISITELERKICHLEKRLRHHEGCESRVMIREKTDPRELKGSYKRTRRDLRS